MQKLYQVVVAFIYLLSVEQFIYIDITYKASPWFKWKWKFDCDLLVTLTLSS